MRRLLSLLMLVALCAGGWLFFQNYTILGIDQLRVVRKTDAPQSTASHHWARQTAAAPPVDRRGETIRIASFNIQVFGESKASKPQVMNVLVDVLRRFDVIAIQEIRSRNQDVLPQLIEQINANGRKYDFILGERLGRTVSKEQYAYIFDAQSIEVDRSATYTVRDPDGLLHRPPLVSAFRVRGPTPEQAFTFTLINIHTDPDETDTELDYLDDVYRAVRDDQRGEDDVILLGDLNVDDRHLGQLGQVAGIAWVFSGVPTNTRGTKLYDNILFHRRSTSEFTGKAGVFDVMREFNLTMQQALEVSDHLPVWAEFHIHETPPGERVAERPEKTTATK